VSLLPGLPAAVSVVRLASEQGHEPGRFLGLPLWIWQFLNLALFLGVLLYFVARPLGEAFRKRQLEIEQRRLQAEQQRAAVDRLAHDIRERTAKIEREIDEIRGQGRADGEQAHRELAARADEEAERVRKDALDEIERRIAAAKDELRKTAADLTAATATEILSREITPADRERLLAESLSGLRNA
jgi:F0F1-type ATP synthase membrane subunit b/b'